MKIEIKSAWISEPDNYCAGNVRVWEPEDPRKFSVMVCVEIGVRGQKLGEQFYIRLATPDGLKAETSENSIICKSPLIVVDSYSYDDIWKLLMETVDLCQSSTWSECLEKLQRYFTWEYEGYES